MATQSDIAQRIGHLINETFASVSMTPELFEEAKELIKQTVRDGLENSFNPEDKWEFNKGFMEFESGAIGTHLMFSKNGGFQAGMVMMLEADMRTVTSMRAITLGDILTASVKHVS